MPMLMYPTVTIILNGLYAHLLDLNVIDSQKILLDCSLLVTCV